MEWWEKIERYTEGNMEPAECLVFQNQLENDPVLAEQVKEYQHIRHSFELLKKRRQLKEQLELFHAEIDPLQQQEALRVYKNRQKWRKYFGKYLPTVAVAASVAIVTALSTLFTLGYLKNIERSQRNSLQLLHRELDQIKRDIKSAKDTLKRAFPRAGRQRFEGTGFATSTKGYLITSYHLVAQADSIFIESATRSGMRYKAEVVFTNPTTDLAILKVTDGTFKDFGKIPYTFKKESMDLGEEIFTLAYPKNDLVYGEGNISSPTGFEGDSTAYQISIPVNPGNSGSPVFDENGNIIGLVSGKLTGAEGVAFALKSSVIWKLLKDSLPDKVNTIIELPKQSRLAGKKRTVQLKTLQDFIFQVKVY
ncbi:MAG: serine protease [Cytophagales bacterium]|nr:serine protease [Bernardetiaceae bacterium]MDW8211742.1 serine protease [Cytophagales bacterium]